MSDMTAISTANSPPAALPRPLSDAVDLYAEGNSFSEAQWAGPDSTALFGKDGFTFKDVLDIINPLQHLPVVGTAYRALTGDDLAPAPRIIGGTLYGGIAGFVTSLVNAVIEDETGSDMGDTVLALFTDKAAPPDAVASLPAAPSGTPVAATAAPATAPASAAFPAKPATHAAGLAGLTAALKTHSTSDDENDPTAALIRAHAAVPASRRAALGGIPQKSTHSSIAMPGGKSMPIKFGARTTSSAPAQAPAAAEPPVALAKSAATPDGKPAPAAAFTDPDVAFKMRDALNKYEALMKSRTAPSLSGEI